MQVKIKLQRRKYPKDKKVNVVKKVITYDSRKYSEIFHSLVFVQWKTENKFRSRSKNIGMSKRN